MSNFESRCLIDSFAFTSGSCRLHAGDFLASLMRRRATTTLSLDRPWFARAGHRRRHRPNASRFSAAGLFVHVAHTDERSQQLLWTDVRPYPAGHYRASEQRADCFGQAIERKRREIRRAVNRKRQRGGHALLGGDELDIGSQPAAQGIDGRGRILQCFCQFDELLHLAAIDCFEHILTRREVAVERTDADTCLFSDGLQASFPTARAEHRFCGRQHSLAIANRIGARPPNRVCRLFCHHCYLDHEPFTWARIIVSSRCLRMIFSESLAPNIDHSSCGPLENGGCLRIWRWTADLERAADRSAPIQV